MGMRPHIPDPVAEKLGEIQDEHDLPNHGEAVRHALREAGYDL